MASCQFITCDANNGRMMAFVCVCVHCTRMMYLYAICDMLNECFEPVAHKSMILTLASPLFLFIAVPLFSPLFSHYCYYFDRSLVVALERVLFAHSWHFIAYTSG